MMIRTKFLCVASIGLIFFGVFQTQISTAESSFPSALPSTALFVQELDGIREFHLPNGLQVLLIADSRRVNTTIEVVYRSGSNVEYAGEKGIAHLLEHLAYLPGNVSVNLFKYYAQRHMTGNGKTSFDFTSYKTVVAPNPDAVNEALQLEAKRMSNFPYSDLNLKEALAQVLHEKENTDASGTNTLVRRTESLLFFWSAYGKDPIGTPSDLTKIDLTMVRRYWETEYRPDNTAIVVSGKIDEGKTLSAIEAAFAGINKPGNVRAKVVTQEPVQDGEREVTVRRKRTAQSIMIGYRTEAAAHPDVAAAELLGNILGDDEFGRLEQKLVKAKLVKSFGTYAMYMRDGGVLLFEVKQAYGDTITQPKNIILGELEQIKKRPITQAELNQAKKNLRDRYTKYRADTDGLSGTLANHIANGDWRLYYVNQERMQNMSLADLQRIAESWLTPTNRAMCTVVEDENLNLRVPTEASLEKVRSSIRSTQ